jgi:hypothetical protein
MNEFGISAKLISLTKMSSQGHTIKLKSRRKLSRNFRTECGFRQEDPLSTLLFNIGLEEVMRNIEL